MATLLEGSENPTSADAASFKAELYDTASRCSTTGDAIKAQLPNLVKGAGLAQIGSNTPLTDQADITVRAHQAALDLRTATMQGYQNRASVVKSMNQDFLNQFGNLKTALTTPSIGEQIQQAFQAVGNPDLVRSFTAGNLGIGSIN